MKIRVAVLFGGKSTEHEISIISAVQAMHALDTQKYDVVPVYLTKENVCYTGEHLKEIATFQKNLADIPAGSIRVDFIKEDKGVVLMRHDRKRFGDNVISGVDVALPVMHGTNTEDGTLTGFLLTLGLPVAGCDVLSSAVGMNKYVMKTVLNDNGIPVLPCVRFHAADFADPETVAVRTEEAFRYPVVVKPVNLGSSIGISRAKNREELLEAAELAFTFSGSILVEPAITELKEVNCAVLGDSEEAIASECESPLGEDEILSFEDKYMGGGKGKSGVKAPVKGVSASADAAKGSGMASLKRKLPADISDEKRTEIREMAVRAFRALGCCGVSRLDFMMDRADHDKVYLNEINTIPGSMSFYLWEATNLPYTELLDRVIELGLKADRENRKRTYSFETNVLAGVRL